MFFLHEKTEIDKGYGHSVISSLVAEQSPVSGFSKGKLLAPSSVMGGYHLIGNVNKINPIKVELECFAAPGFCPAQSSAIYITSS